MSQTQEKNINPFEDGAPLFNPSEWSEITEQQEPNLQTKDASQVKIVPSTKTELSPANNLQVINDKIDPIAKVEQPETNLQPNDNKAKIRFICEYSKNFLSTEAPSMPALVSMNIKGVSTTFIPKGIVGSVVGAGGIGKTHWLTQLSLAVTTNENFLGTYSIAKIGYVALILGENSYDDIHRILRKTVDGFFGQDINNYQHKIEEASKRLAVMSVTGMDASFLDHNGKHTDFYEQMLKDLIDKEPEDGWSLIVLDPASRFLGADAETDNAKATLFIASLENMIQKLKGKPTILFGHHMSKSSRGKGDTDASASRGSSALTDGVRWQLNLDPISDINTKIHKDDRLNFITMRVTKSNHTPPTLAQILKKDGFGHLTIEKEDKDEQNHQVARDSLEHDLPIKDQIAQMSKSYKPDSKYAKQAFGNHQ